MPEHQQHSGDGSTHTPAANSGPTIIKRKKGPVGQPAESKLHPGRDPRLPRHEPVHSDAAWLTGLHCLWQNLLHPAFPRPDAHANHGHGSGQHHHGWRRQRGRRAEDPVRKAFSSRDRRPHNRPGGDPGGGCAARGSAVPRQTSGIRPGRGGTRVCAGLCRLSGNWIQRRRQGHHRRTGTQGNHRQHQTRQTSTPGQRIGRFTG